MPIFEVNVLSFQQNRKVIWTIMSSFFFRRDVTVSRFIHSYALYALNICVCYLMVDDTKKLMRWIEIASKVHNFNVLSDVNTFLCQKNDDDILW